ncbi:MAG TPA: hypothetical protein VGK19_17095 [Capsulimonadaceae bacterium]|jgi:hypothetical protein
MMAWVHASVGAFIGGRAGSKKRAFSAGVVSHGVLDKFPHRDYEIPVELPLCLIALAYIAKRHGVKSPEFAGAIGGISPDFENALSRFGLLKTMLYPTHTSKPWFIGHGRRIESPVTQIILAGVCLYLAHRWGKASG